MLGLGWSEMLIIGIVILIVVGPKDLPMMMRNVGRMMGTVRRMSNEFRREIDKAIAADELREARKAISDPLKQTSDEISREFNAMRNGKVEPSGRLAPSEPGKESVVDEIRAQAGMAPVSSPEKPAAALANSAEMNRAPANPANGVTTTAEAIAPETPAPITPKVKAAPRNGGTSTAKVKAAKPTKSTGTAAEKRAPAKRSSSARAKKAAANTKAED